MKKLFCFCFSFMVLSGVSQAQENADNFYQDLLVTDEVIAEENKDIAVENARKMLDSKPKILKLRNNKVVKLPNRKTDKYTPVNYNSAPFGLIWGATTKKIENLGVNLTPTGEKDYMNNYSATNLPNSLHDFRNVILTFGINNSLWRIIAYGNFIQDDPEASGVMAMYRQYYKLLSQKYGNAQEFYTPNVINVDVTTTDSKGKPQTVTEQKEQAIGNPNFLSELQNGTAELYATFENGMIGAALSVNVDGSGQSYITVDYKNLNLMKERDNEALNAL